MTSLNVGDAVAVWMGPSAGERGTLERKEAIGGDGWTWVVLRTLEGKEVRTHAATVEPYVESYPKKEEYSGTFY